MLSRTTGKRRAATLSFRTNVDRNTKKNASTNNRNKSQATLLQGLISLNGDDLSVSVLRIQEHCGATH